MIFINSVVGYSSVAVDVSLVVVASSCPIIITVSPELTAEDFLLVHAHVQYCLRLGGALLSGAATHEGGRHPAPL